MKYLSNGVLKFIQRKASIHMSAFLVFSVTISFLNSGFAMPKKNIKAINKKNLLRLDQEKAKENITLLFKDVPLDEKRKKLLEEEVLSYAVLFSEKSENLSLSKFQSYLSFSSESLASVEESGKNVVPLCFEVVSLETCAECNNVKQFLTKYMTSRLQKRGFDLRKLKDLEEIPNVSLSSRRAYEAFLDQATRQGCDHILYIGVDLEEDKIHTGIYMDVKDIGKRHHFAHFESSENKSPTEEGLFTQNTALLVRGTNELFTSLGDIKGIYSQGIGMISKCLSLEGQFTFDSYNLFKRKLLESMMGLTALEEKLMTSGKIVFVVNGDISLAAINNQIVEVIGPSPTIVSHELVDENLLKVVIR